MATMTAHANGMDAGRAQYLRRRALRQVTEVALPVLVGLVVLASWQSGALNDAFGIDANTLPLPSRICQIIIDNLPKVMTNVQATLFVALVGLTVGSVAGYAFALLAVVSPKFGRSGLGIVAAFNAVPIVALAPVMTNWTRGVSPDANARSMVAKVLVVMILCIAAMSFTCYRGLTEVKPFSLDLMSSYAASKRQVFLKLRLPNSVPYVFTALKVSVPMSIITAIVAEYFAEFIIGVGRQIRENIVLAQFPTAWAYILVACVMGLVMYALLVLVEGVVRRRMNFDR